jgi:hypothetical protein
VANLIIFILKNDEKPLKIHKIFMFLFPFSGKKIVKLQKFAQNKTLLAID